VIFGNMRKMDLAEEQKWKRTFQGFFGLLIGIGKGVFYWN